MKVTEKVILDLLPLYFGSEASEDSQHLIERYFAEHPQFGEKMKREYENQRALEVPVEYKPEEEMKILRNTQLLLRLRTWTLVIAMFGLLFPLFYFTFADFKGQTFEGYWWVFTNPVGLIFILGLIGLLGYFGLRYRMRTTQI